MKREIWLMFGIFQLQQSTAANQIAIPAAAECWASVATAADDQAAAVAPGESGVNARRARRPLHEQPQTGRA